MGWDPLILDDQAILLHVRDKWLVILTGCGHAGIVNTVRYAQKLTGIEQIYAIIGAFHLGGLTPNRSSSRLAMHWLPGGSSPGKSAP